MINKEIIELLRNCDSTKPIVTYCFDKKSSKWITIDTRQILDVIDAQQKQNHMLSAYNNILQSRRLLLFEKKKLSKIMKDFVEELKINLDGDIEAYHNAGHDLNIYKWLMCYLESKIENIKECIDIEVNPIKHGKWLINSDGYYPYCSECKNEPENGVMTDYCSNCGASMKESGLNA